MTPELEERLRDRAARAADAFDSSRDRLGSEAGLSINQAKRKRQKAPDEQVVG